MKLLVLGSGGREAALAWKLAQSPQVHTVIVAPGNAGMTLLSPKIQIRLECTADQAVQEKIDLTVIGPDALLEAGWVDEFRRRGLAVFGPTREAARLEWSKAFAKEVMLAAQVKTARYCVVHSAEQARKVLTTETWARNSVVIKADGLALGKGVRVCLSPLEAEATFVEWMDSASEEARKFGWVLEEYLEGREISWMALCDGERAALFEPVRDHKRLGEGNTGPNTGGMGVIGPVDACNRADVDEKVHREVFLPVLKEMKRRGTPFQGVLFAGLMRTVEGEFSVLEFNARWGDPETQLVLARMEGDLLPWLIDAVRGQLPGPQPGHSVVRIPSHPGYGVFAVAAAPGYPEQPQKGARVDGIEKILKTSAGSLPAGFIAGLSPDSQGGWKVSGGRVLGTLGTGLSLAQARNEALSRLDPLSLSQGQLQYRKDLGLKPRLVALASGRGSNFEALDQAIQRGDLWAEWAAVVTDQPQARVIELARQKKIPVWVVEKKVGESCVDHESRILEKLSALPLGMPTWAVLAGYMRVLSGHFLKAFEDSRGFSRVVNIHPSLLPSFPGLNAYRQAWESGCQTSGVTVHWVDSTLDGGPIIEQAPFSLLGCESLEEVEARGLAKEHELYARALERVLLEPERYWRSPVRDARRE